MYAARIAFKHRSTMLRAASTRAVLQGWNQRLLSTPAAAAASSQMETCIRTENVDFVREAINRMLNSKAESDLKPIADEDLEQSLLAFAVSALFKGPVALTNAIRAVAFVPAYRCLPLTNFDCIFVLFIFLVC